MKIRVIKNSNRNDIASMFGELGFRRGAEVGVRRGDFSAILCKSIKSSEKLYSVDPWDLVFEDTRSNSYGPDVLENQFKDAQKKLSKYAACEIIRKTSLEAVRKIPYKTLDFVYIDGSHRFDYVMTDIIEWSKRVKRGGIVSGDDYKKHNDGDVITPVNTYVQAHSIEVLNIVKPKENDKYPIPNWWFQKP